MADALASGKVSRYVTDFPNPAVVNMPGALVLPHLGASTEESEENCAVMAVNQIMDYLENGNIENSVNYPNPLQPWLPQKDSTYLCMPLQQTKCY